jgi:hypothetical protein
MCRSILLLEDVDAAFVDRSAGGGGAARLTFSGLLNAIDGVSRRLLHAVRSMHVYGGTLMPAFGTMPPNPPAASHTVCLC